MDGLQVSLFGRISVKWAGEEATGLETRKVQELLAFLLVYRTRTHSREVLAELLWGDRPQAQARKYLRQALWQLQTVLEQTSGASSHSWLDVDPDWVRVSASAELWLDVAELERAYSQAQGVAGGDLSDECALALERAAQLYRGDFLEGCYEDWCLFERERLQNIYLAMLDKLAQCCEAHRRYEAGLVYGSEALRFDRARERTHRRMMRLHYLAGDRTAALRQYEQLTATLKAELDVRPSRRSVALWEQIRADRLDDTPSSPLDGTTIPPELPAVQARRVGLSDRSASPTVQEAVQRLKQLQVMLGSIQRQVRQEIEVIELGTSDAKP